MRAFGRYSLSSFLSAILTTASVGVLIALVVAVFVLITSPWTEFGRDDRLGIPVALAIDAQALRVQAPSLGPGSARLTKVRGTLEFTAPSNRAVMAPMVTVIAMLLLASWAIHQLRELFRALDKGQVFAPQNVRRVQRV